MAHINKSGSGRRTYCKVTYEDVVEQVQKKHRAIVFTREILDGMGLLACRRGSVPLNERGLSSPHSRYKCQLARRQQQSIITDP
jgi:hypothetical protein